MNLCNFKAYAIARNLNLDGFTELESLAEPMHSGLRFPTAGFNAFYGIGAREDFMDLCRDEELESEISGEKGYIDPYRVQLSIMAYRDSKAKTFGENINQSNVVDLRCLSDDVEAEVVQFFGQKAEEKYGRNLLTSMGCIDDKSGQYNLYTVELFPEFIDDLVCEKVWMKGKIAIIWNARIFSDYDASSHSWIDEGRLVDRVTILDSDYVIVHSEYRRSHFVLPEIHTEKKCVA
jgi:hypothetical protein